jgi:hypothetical protein
MGPAEVVISGKGFAIDASPSHPAGMVYSGGYDAELNKLFLASSLGHPGGMAAGGGDPSKADVSGVRLFLYSAGDMYWANDSMSLPRKLSEMEINAVQRGLQNRFPDRLIHQLERLEGIPQ